MLTFLCHPARQVSSPTSIMVSTQRARMESPGGITFWSSPITWWDSWALLESWCCWQFREFVGYKSGLLHSCIFSGFKAVKIWLFCTAVMSKILLDSGQLFTLSNLLVFKTPVQGKQSIVPQTQKHLWHLWLWFLNVTLPVTEWGPLFALATA